jgi:PKD domain
MHVGRTTRSGMSGMSDEPRPGLRRSAPLIPVLVVGLVLGLVVGLTTPATARTASGSGASGVLKAKPPVLKAILSLSPQAATVGQRVTASLSKSTLPKGDKVKKITVNWGDRTRIVAPASLTKKPLHRYASPGHYTVHLTITDHKNKVVRTTALERITAPAGSYSGLSARELKFYVSSTGASLQDISLPSGYYAMTCAPGGATVWAQFGLPAVALKSDGSFSVTTTANSVYPSNTGNYPAKFTYKFRGHFNGVDTTGSALVVGQFRETMTYTDSAPRACTTGDQSWTATRDVQPAQRNPAPPTGSYSGLSAEELKFYISASRTRLQDISLPSGYYVLNCAPGTTNIWAQFAVAAAAIKADRSFAVTTIENGVYAGKPARFTYTFRGNFHSVGSDGSERAAGTFRETLTYTDSAARSCTSGDQPWTASRDAQPTQTNAAPPSGSYAGLAAKELTFDVSSDGTALQDISLPSGYYALNCTPGGATVWAQFSIDAASIKADRSFTTTTTDNGVYAGHPAKFTYTFTGNFHSVGPDGAERAAGTFRETLAFTDTAPRNCTTMDQSWTASRTAS